MKKIFYFFLLPLFTQAQSKLAIEQLLAAPFPTEIVTAPVGNRVAWVQNTKGIRNIMTAQSPDFQGKVITNYTDDDGQEITQLEWTPDGQTVYYVRGGSPNRAGEMPNPTSNPAGVETAIWKASVNGGVPQKITRGTQPVVSPKGDSLVLIGRGQIYIASVATGKERQLLQIRGGASTLRWSPDGSKLTFVSNRGDHGFVGVYDLVKKSLQYLSPSVDTDVEPVWSPDGTKIAFLRMAAEDPVIFVPVRESEPWSIMVADLTTNQTKTVWKADKGKGSAFHEIVADSQLFWTDGDRLVFPWEKDGWVHLYAVAATGGVANLLTPGAFEVEYVTMSADRKSLIFNSNQDDIDRRHLWRVSPTGGLPILLTAGKNIEWGPALFSDGKTIAYLESGAKAPAHAAVLSNGKRQNMSALPADFQDALVEPEAVSITASDGMVIPCQLFVPKNMAKGEKRPAIIFFHGGSRRQMLLGFHYGLYYHNAYALNQYLASLGYVVLAVNYRSGVGYGMEFREALNYGAAGCSEYNDVTGAGIYLKNRPDVDAKKIGLWGGSYGGYLTAMGLARSSDLFAAGVDIHGVHDENQSIKNFIPSYNHLEHPDEARLALLSSPMHYLDGWRSPVLVIHGDDDRNVNFYQTVMLVRELRKRNVETEQLVFPDEVHSFLTYQHWLQAYQATIDFFERKLKK